MTLFTLSLCIYIFARSVTVENIQKNRASMETFASIIGGLYRFCPFWQIFTIEKASFCNCRDFIPQLCHIPHIGAKGGNARGTSHTTPPMESVWIDWPKCRKSFNKLVVEIG